MVEFVSAFYIALVLLVLFAMIGILIGIALEDPIITIILFFVFGFIGTAAFPMIFGFTKAFIAMITGGG